MPNFVRSARGVGVSRLTIVVEDQNPDYVIDVLEALSGASFCGTVTSARMTITERIEWEREEDYEY